MGGGGRMVGGGGAVLDKRSLVFTYGTLKQGFSNHVLIQDLINSGNASFLGTHRTNVPYPLVCGPYRVPFLLNLPGKGEKVYGEVYAVSPFALARMDELEGTSTGHYERLPIKVLNLEDEEEEGNLVEAQAYYGHRSYADELWRRSGEKGYRMYSEKEARGYVKRKDRPQGITFLDQIRSFVTANNAATSVA